MLKVAVDYVFDSVSVATTFREKLADEGIIFCPISEAVQNHPDLVKKYIGSVIPIGDNYYAALNSAVFTDGSFVFVPKGVKCPMDLSTYFRINEQNSCQFERLMKRNHNHVCLHKPKQSFSLAITIATNMKMFIE